MSFTPSLRKVFGPRLQASHVSRPGKSRQPSRQLRRSPSFKPLLEMLEDRTLPSGVTLTIDRPDHVPGTTAMISGSGFNSGETVNLTVTHIDGKANTDLANTSFTATADTNGAFQTSWVVTSGVAAGSTLQVRATGQSSLDMADAIVTTPPVSRPFWIFAHNPDTVAITEKYIDMGVNALEPDIEYFSGKSGDPVSKGFYIAHQLDTSFLGQAGFSNFSNPTLSFHDYLDQLSTYLSTKFPGGNTQLSLVELDVKTEACNAPGALTYIVNTIKTEILPQHPELYFLINAGAITDANALFTSKADDVLSGLPASHFGFSIDGEDHPDQVVTTLHTLLGNDANIGYGDGTAGAGERFGKTVLGQGIIGGGLAGLSVDTMFKLLAADPEGAAAIFGLSIASLIVGDLIHLGPNVFPAVQQGVFDRTAFGNLNMLAYGFSITGTDVMKELIDSGVDGMIPADSLDVTSPFSVHGFSAIVAGQPIGTQSYGDTQDALDLVNSQHYGNTRMATTADDPFSIHGAVTDPDTNQSIVTGSRDGYTLEVKTTDLLALGPNSSLTFTLHGQNGDASATVQTDLPGEFGISLAPVVGDTNYVFIPSADLGALDSVSVFNHSSSIFHDWHVDSIKVRSLTYLGAGTVYDAEFGGQDVGNQLSISFGALGSLHFDTSDQNPATRSFGNYLTATSLASATGGVEGETAATLAGATFQDRVTATTSADMSVTAVDWGDGSTDASGLTISGGNGHFTVNGSHLYTEDGNFAFSITVKAGGNGADKDQTATIRGEVDVVDPAVVLIPATFNATEGTTSTVQTLATFTDPGGAEPLTDYAVDVDWGNGTFVTDANVSISGPVGGVFTVTGKHLYTDEDGYPGPVRVRITHEAGRTSEDGTSTEVVSVVSVPLTLTDPPASATAAAGPFVATEGTMSAVQTLATFTDPAGAEAVPDYTVDVDWGNGAFVSGDANVSISGPVIGMFTVTGKHLYTDEDNFTGPIHVRINHEASTPSPVVSVSLSLTDPPVNATRVAGPFLATEGTMSALQTVATFTDPGGPETPSDYVVDVDWGNGTFVLADPNVTISGPVDGVFTVMAQHLYHEEEGFPGPVQVRINHEGSTPSPVVSLPVQITDPPLIAAGTSLAAVRGACPNLNVATFTDPGGAEPNLFDPGPLSNHYTATIHWGDGTSDDVGNITYNGIPLDDSPTNTFTVSAHHDYTTNGTYTITVTMHHEGAVPDAVVTTKVTVVSLLNHAPGLFDANSLVIGAALSGSSVQVVPAGKQTGALTDSVQVLIDGVAQINTATGGTTFTGFNSITIFGQAGNDNLEVAGSVQKNTAFFGSGGNDRMKGGAGNDIFVGGKGNDTIIGGTGQDIMIGGGGNDHLVGGPGGDILIGGYTDFDDPCDPAGNGMLRAIQAAWTNPTATFTARAAAVLALFSTDGSNAAHIHEDSGTTSIAGGSGPDLFFAALVDPLTGRPLGKK